MMCGVLLCALCTTWALLTAAAPTKKPHIILIVGDDVGSNDFGWHDELPGRGNRVSLTPVMDSLAMGGVRLGSFYTFKLCSPSRSMIMTGRYTFHFGYYDNIDADGPNGGVPLTYSMLPADLKRAGYATHAAGKWHCGYRTKAQVPTSRGFDTWLGYFHAEENYYTHLFGGEVECGPVCGNKACCGVDFTEGSKAGELRPYPGLAHNGTQVVDGAETPLYSTYLYIGRALELIEERNQSQPFFLYLPLQNVHGPTESPQRFKDMFPDHGTMNGYRLKIMACMSAMDEGVANLTQTLRANGMWENTVLFFQADNGGDVGGSGFGMNNWPLRGGKWTNWEGGVRVASFIHSPLLPKTRAGTVYMGLVHATDWRPTFAFLAGVQPDESGPYPLDGHSIWDAVASGGPSPRNEVVMNIIKPSSNYNKTCTSPMAIYCNHSGHSASGAAIRQGQYKLVVGYAGWPDLRFQLPAATQPYGNTQQAMVDPADQTLRCADKCLFDVVADPGESEDLQAKLPEVVAKLEARLAELAKEGMPRLYTQDCAPHCGDDCAQVQKTGYYLPYQDHEVL